MAVSAIVRTIAALIKKHGLSSGVKKARKLGFNSKDIRKAAITHGKKYGGVTLEHPTKSGYFASIGPKAKRTSPYRAKLKAKARKRY